MTQSSIRHEEATKYNNPHYEPRESRQIARCRRTSTSPEYDPGASVEAPQAGNHSSHQDWSQDSPLQPEGSNGVARCLTTRKAHPSQDAPLVNQLSTMKKCQKSSPSKHKSQLRRKVISKSSKAYDELARSLALKMTINRREAR